MNETLYNVVLFLAKSLAYFATFFSRGRIALWQKKRERIWEKLDDILAGNKAPLIWVHVSSRGETEQVLPLIELIKRHHPQYKVLLTIFSASAERNLDEVDYMCYLPLDGRLRAERLLNLIKPKLVIWVKYDFWYFYLRAIHQRKIPLILISAIFSKQQKSLQKPFRNFYLRMLSFFSKIHVQNQASKQLLASLGINQQIIDVSGDTRFDRVKSLAKSIQSQAPILPLSQIGKKIIVCGSTRIEDYPVLQQLQLLLPDIYMVIVPHDIDPKNINVAKRYFENPIFLSTVNHIPLTHHTLVVDKMGILIHLYNEADFCYVGGGFSHSGIHNILEPASFGKPIFIGKNYQAYHEAVQMSEQGICLTVNNGTELYKKIRDFIAQPEAYASLCEATKTFIAQQQGASERILSDINQWL